MTRENMPTGNVTEAADAAAASTGADKHRQHARLRTRERARLLLPEGPSLLCEIRDFSRNGLQLVGLDRRAADAVLGHPLDADTHVDVEFPLDEDGAVHYRLRGNLAHASAVGFGVRLDNMTNEAYQALVQARANIPNLQMPATGLLPEENQALLRDCINLFHFFLDRVWRDFLDAIAAKVAERNTAQLALADHSRYLNALSELLLRGGETSRMHYASLVKQMYRMGEPREEPDRLPANDMELSIVDDSSFDDWLNITNVANRIEGDLRQPMFQFAQRFSRLTPVQIDKHNDPFGPESVCLAFQDALSQFDLNNEMRALIYKLFGEALAVGYGDLYESLNQLLSPLKPAKRERARPHLVETRPSAREVAGITPLPEPESPDDHQEASAGDISAQIGKLAEIAEALFALSPGSRPPSPTHLPEEPADTAESGVAHREPEGFQALRHTLAQLAARQSGTLATGSDRSTPAYAPSIDELLTAAPPGPSLTQRMSVLLGQGEVGRLDSRQRESLDLATNLMNLAMREHTGESDLDGLLKKLEKPLYELVLRGEDPLNQVDHPLRRLLNLVDRFAIVTDDHGKFMDRELGDLLVTIIDHATEHAASEPDSFTKAGDALEKLLKFPSQFHQQRVVSHQEFSEGQNLIRTAKLTVAGQLDQALAGRPVARTVLTVLDQGLRQHLVLQTLRGNGGECQATLDLITALRDKDSRPPPDDILERVKDRLRDVNTDRRRVEGCLAELAAYLAGPAGSDYVSLPPGWFLKEASPAQAGQEAMPPDLPAHIGEWWDFDQTDRAVPMQLVWISSPPGVYGFVNRAATRNVQLTSAELAKRQADGTIRRGEDRDVPLLDRSENSAVDNLYRRLAHRVHHDQATNLLNRKGLMHAAAHQPNRSGKGHVTCMLEFTPFRAILDTCGIEVSEHLTSELAAIVQRRVGPADLLASIGDGRFALLLPDLDIAGARKLADSIEQAVRGFQFRHGQSHYTLEAQIGLASFIPGLVDPEEALRRATTACNVAMQSGQAIQAYEDSGEQVQAQESLHRWGQRIDGLLSGHGLFLRCQQIAPLREDIGVQPYYEVLLGLRDEAGAVVSPQPFVEAVEYWKRTHDLDLWVIEQTFAWARENREAFARIGGFSINLSALSMTDGGILDTLHTHLSPGDIAPEKIVFEITETATVGNYDAAREFIRQIRHYGCRFSIDDFGSGNASYGYLRNLRTDTLKIDGTFVKDMVGDPDLLAMVKSMNDIGHSLGMKTVAEFVASPEILALVREIGVDYGQGFEIARPIHLDELAAL